MKLGRIVWSCTCEKSCPCIQSQALQCTADGSSQQFWGWKKLKSPIFRHASLLWYNVTPELHCYPSKLLPVRSHVKIYPRQGCSLEIGSKLPCLVTFISGSNAGQFDLPPQLTAAWHQLQLHKPKIRARWSQKLLASERLSCQEWRPLQFCKAASFQDWQDWTKSSSSGGNSWQSVYS